MSMAPASIGTAIGIEIADITQTLSAKSSFTLKEGMTFNVSLGAHLL